MSPPKFMIDDHEERLALRRGVIARGGDEPFLKGSAGALAKALANLIGAKV